MNSQNKGMMDNALAKLNLKNQQDITNIRFLQQFVEIYGRLPTETTDVCLSAFMKMKVKTFMTPAFVEEQEKVSQKQQALTLTSSQPLNEWKKFCQKNWKHFQPLISNGEIVPQPTVIPNFGLPRRNRFQELEKQLDAFVRKTCREQQSYLPIITPSDLKSEAEKWVKELADVEKKSYDGLDLSTGWARKFLDRNKSQYDFTTDPPKEDEVTQVKELEIVKHGIYNRKMITYTFELIY